MRYVYMVLVVLGTLAVLLFMVQNLASVTVSFMSTRVTMPIWSVVVVVYVLGMITGGALWSLLRASVRGAFERR
jgi:lipopolysaccharide assembly protein A